MHPEFAPIAFICAAALILPLPWHLQAGNIATLSIIFWLFITNVILGVDAILWAGNAVIQVPVWCDITTKILLGSNYALPAACLCISIHLEQMASLRVAHTGQTERRNRRIFEAFMCFGMPILFMGLHYIVQGHRFDIIEDFGCRVSQYFSVPSIIIIYVPPMIMSLATLVFSALALRHFMIRRLTFAAHLQTSNPALTTSRYLRLMAMATVQMVWSLAFCTFALVYTLLTLELRPWTTWSDVHSDWSRIDQFLTSSLGPLIPPLISNGYTALWWATPASTIIFVAFFAFGRDAVMHYKRVFSNVTASFTTKDKKPFGGKQMEGLPVYSSTTTANTGIRQPQDKEYLPVLCSTTSTSSTMVASTIVAGSSCSSYSYALKDLPNSPTTSSTSSSFSPILDTPPSLCLSPLSPPPAYIGGTPPSPTTPTPPISFNSYNNSSSSSKLNQFLRIVKAPLIKHEQSFETVSSFSSPGIAIGSTSHCGSGSIQPPQHHSPTVTPQVSLSQFPSPPPQPQPLCPPRTPWNPSSNNSSASLSTITGTRESRPLTYPSFDAANAHRGSVVPYEDWIEFS